MLGLLEKTTLTPALVSAQDLLPLLAMGVSEQAIKDALLICACFNVIARLADAFDVAVPTAEQFAFAGEMLLKYGYT